MAAPENPRSCSRTEVQATVAPKEVSVPIPDLAPGSALRRAAEAMAEGPLAYLIGAGASVSAGLPTWGQLLRQLLHDRGLDETSIGRLLESQDNLLVAEAAFTPTMRRDTKEKRIFRALYGTDDPSIATGGYTPSAMHLAVATDVARRGSSAATVMTVNYDDLTEEALVSVLGKRRVRDPEQRVHGRGAATDRAAPDQFEVHHLHGLLPRESRSAVGDRLVLTLSDYTRIMESSWQRTQVSDAVQHGPTLMLGTSYSDPDIRTWLGRLQARERRPLLALISRPAFGLSRSQMARIAPVLAAQWESIGVDVHLVDDFATPTQIVRELGAVTQEGYTPPAQRVAKVLAERLDDFAAAQDRDATLLATLARKFTSVLGDDVVLTLWIHDGGQSLVRWAASDRLYRNKHSLRRIDANPDSPWIVSRAVCDGTEVIRDITARTAELHHQDQTTAQTGRWIMVAARPLAAILPGGPLVTIGALSIASTRADADVDRGALQDALDPVCRKLERSLSEPS